MQWHQPIGPNQEGKGVSMKPSSNAVGREAARKVHKNGSFLTPVSSRCSLQDHHTI